MNHCLFQSVAFTSALLFAALALADDKDKKKEEKKPEPPRIIMAVPLAVKPGEKVSVGLRGLKLDNVTAVRIGEGEKKIEAKLTNKGGAKPPDRYEAKQVGDTKVDIEFALPADAPGVAEGKIKIIAVNDGGESEAYELRVIAGDALVQEKEPNDAFKTAQPVAAGQTVAGTMQGNNQVDVFAYTATKGEKIIVEVFAARLGSAFDASITLFDPTSNIVTLADDIKGSRDSVLTFTASMDGVYLFVLQDAMDRGDSTHPYLLEVKK